MCSMHLVGLYVQIDYSWAVYMLCRYTTVGLCTCCAHLGCLASGRGPGKSGMRSTARACLIDVASGGA